MTPQQLEQQLAEQQKLLEAIYVNTQKTRKYIFLGKVMSFVYLILFLAPIIFAIIYLPPLINNTIGPYRELLGSFGGVGPAGKEAKIEGTLGNIGDLQDFLRNLSSGTSNVPLENSSPP